MFNPWSIYYEDKLPHVISGINKKLVVTITTGKNLKRSDKRYYKFNDDNLFTMDRNRDHNDQPIFTQYKTKKSLWLDIKNYINHE